MTVIEHEVVVNTVNGVHGRVATQLAMIARQNSISLHLLHDGRVIDCASILDVLSLAFGKGSRFKVRISGEKKKVEYALQALDEIFA